ncbi:MAG: hypothetical protein Q9218_005969 [Villophora microphyllina]
MIVQGWMHIRDTVREMGVDVAKTGQPQLVGSEKDQEQTSAEASLSQRGEYAEGILLKSRMEKTSHTPETEEKPRYDLKNSTMMGWIQGKQLRKCTLCLEEMKDPSATTCGHGLKKDM